MCWRRLLLVLGLLVGTPLPASGHVGANGRDASDAAWATIRAKVPTEQPVYRPTWLPDRFRQPGRAATSPFINVGYTSDEGDNLLFFYGGSNSCAAAPILDEPILVHGVKGGLAVYPRICYPQIMVNWREDDAQYTIAGNKANAGRPAVSREEMLFIIAGLALVAPDGSPVAGPPGRERVGTECFAPTGQCVAGPFLAYWRQHGRLARNGYPLTGEMVEQLEDGRLYQVQYFERTRLEYHPAHNPPYDVLLGQFGRRILAGVPGAPTAPVPAEPGYRYFPETGHNVGPRFGAYWEANGGLAQFGFPLTEPFEQRLEDGKVYRVQYFERARFEHHPENAPPYDVLLGQFGRRILAEGTGR